MDIKQQFAVVVDKDMQATTNKGPNAKAASTNVALRVWGFGTLLDQALTQVRLRYRVAGLERGRAHLVLKIMSCGEDFNLRLHPIDVLCPCR